MTIDPEFVRGLDYWKKWLWVISVTLGYALVVWGGMELSRWLEERGQP
ncbi:hypothetical protein TCCBUS3UF1_760 [Thermus sp. CCB_US3_UF1]|nr:hypothetical protein [Thermus sp.]AEV15126.1 hypothetical protein TCCBUS3UF1_760 [Thermus sp. CCB_US3_UF1]MCS6867277.1 hypothetical protein [Thermus sp.]